MLEGKRQWLLRELIERFNIPHTWLGNRIAEAPDFNQSIRTLGLYLLTASGDPFLVARVCAPEDRDATESLLKEELLSLYSAGIGLVTDGNESRYLRRRFDNGTCEYVTDIEKYSPQSTSAEHQRYQKQFPGIATHKKLSPITRRVENVFFEAHSHIRDIDGLHSDEALDELCKILYAKLYDEEITKEGEPYRLQRWIYGSTEELAAAVRSIYRESNEHDVRVYQLKIPGYERSRGVFDKPIRLSSTALAKVVESLQDYDVSGSAIDIKGRAFQKVLGAATRAGMGQYFTPDPVIKLMVEVSNVTVADLVLDPFCGSAHFLMACLQQVMEHEQDGAENNRYEFAYGKLHGIEKSDRMVRVAMTDMRLHGDGHSNIRCTDALLSFQNYNDLRPESFDLILTNPPFGSILGQASIAQLGDFELGGSRKNVPLEVLGLERCVQFLRPGGRLGIVLPEGLLVNRSTSYVREWVEKVLKVRGLISLPIETFSPFGANIKTCILFARKWMRGEDRSNNYPVFLGRLDDVGYDASGRPRETTELASLAREFREFLSQEGW